MNDVRINNSSREFIVIQKHNIYMFITVSKSYQRIGVGEKQQCNRFSGIMYRITVGFFINKVFEYIIQILRSS